MSCDGEFPGGPVVRRLGTFTKVALVRLNPWSVQSLSRVWLFVTPWTVAQQASMSLHYLLKLVQTHIHQVSDAIQPSNPLLSPSPPASCIRVFSKEATLHIRWPNYWSFSFSISPSNEYSGLISFRINWLDLLADQGTHKSLLQCHSLKAAILWHSASS